MSQGYRFQVQDDGSRAVILESGKGVRNLTAAETAANDRCFRCRVVIGTNSPFHEVNGQRVHVKCTKEF